MQPYAANSYTAILVRGSSTKVFLLQPIAAHSSIATPSIPLLHGSFCQGKGIAPQKASHCSPLQLIAAHSYMTILDRGYFLKNTPLAAQWSRLLYDSLVKEGRVIPQKSSHCTHCIPHIHGSFCHGKSTIPQKDSHCSPLQLIAAHSYMTIIDRVYFHKNPPLAAHWSTLLYGNFCQGVVV